MGRAWESQLFGVLGGGSGAAHRQFQELPDLSLLALLHTGPSELHHIQATWILIFLNTQVIFFHENLEVACQGEARMVRECVMKPDNNCNHLTTGPDCPKCTESNTVVLKTVKYVCACTGRGKM